MPATSKTPATAPKRKQRSDRVNDEERALRGMPDWEKSRKKNGPPIPIDIRPKPRRTSQRETRRWVRNASDELAIAAGCWFDERQAEFVRTWFAKYLVHCQAKFYGLPFELQPWQHSGIIAPIFGWFRPDGTRRFRHAYVEVPKKNGKSTLSSAVGLFMLLGDGERGAEILSAATSREQAAIVHNEAIAMAKASDILRPQLKINNTTKFILHESSGSVYRVISSKPKHTEGFKPHCVIKDELHAWYGRELYDALLYAGAARAQPLSFAMTTAGDDTESICYEVRKRAMKVLAGETEEQRLFALVLALEKNQEGQEIEDYHDSAVHKRLNPMLGITIDPAEFAEDLKAADEEPAALASFKRYRLNVWHTGVNAALNQTAWNALARPLDWSMLSQQSAYLGMDLSSTEDMTAVAMAIPCRDENEAPNMYLSVHFWLPEQAAAEHVLKSKLRAWADAGWLTLTDGNVIDYPAVEEWILQKCRELHVAELAFDPWYGLASAQRIEANAGIPAVSFPQTLASYAKPWADFKSLIKEKTIFHDGNPVMSWQVGNVNQKSDDSGNARPIKPKHGDARKVDGVIAATMACGRAMASLGPRVNFYDHNEVELV